MDGRVIPDNMTVVDVPGSGPGAIVDVSPVNEIIMRLADRRAREADQAFARHWRTITRSLNLRGLQDFLNQRHIVIPRVNSQPEAARVAAELLATPALGGVWLEWMLADLAGIPGLRTEISRRWSSIGGSLQSYAPYAHHCLLALMSLFVAWKHHQISWGPTHMLDLQYMYYLPFCHVFVSEDRVHRFLAPVLIRPNQSFVTMTDFKAGLREVTDRWQSFSEHEQHLLRWALGSYPPPIKDNVVSRLYRRHIHPWEPDRGNQAIKLTEDECREALALVDRLRQKAGEALS